MSDLKTLLIRFPELHGSWVFGSAFSIDKDSRGTAACPGRMFCAHRPYRTESDLSLKLTYAQGSCMILSVKRATASIVASIVPYGGCNAVHDMKSPIIWLKGLSLPTYKFASACQPDCVA